MNPLPLFMLLSLAYGIISLQTARLVWRERAGIFDGRVTARDRAILDRAAFFLLVPIGVLLHEVGHALATWQMGGRVLEFRWYLFMGYVLPSGDFSPLQDWWIALAGNLVGALLGLLAFLGLLLPWSKPWRYLSASFARLQLFVALVFYPLFSLFSRLGDWTQIYSKDAGPWLWPTALGHAGLLAFSAWTLRDARAREWIVSRYAPADMGRLSEIVARDAESADDLNRLGARYANQGEWRLAERAFREAEAADPTDARPLINRARLAQTRGRHDQALSLLRRGLELAQSSDLKRAALTGLAEAELAHYRPREALAHVDAALALSPSDAGLQALREQVLGTAGLGDPL